MTATLKKGKPIRWNSHIDAWVFRDFLPCFRKLTVSSKIIAEEPHFVLECTTLPHPRPLLHTYSSCSDRPKANSMKGLKAKGQTILGS